MKIIVAKNIGFCFGVRRAMNLVEENLRRTKGPIYTLGPLIHNPQVMEELEKKNVLPISKIEEVKKKGKILIRSHGIPRGTLAKLVERRLKIIDATCPYVKRIQHLVEGLAKKNYTVVIFGKANHPEVEALVSYAGGKARVIERIEDLTPTLSGLNKKIGLVSQTTQSIGDFQKVVSFFQSSQFQNKKVKIYNTLCPTTKKRQVEAAKLAKEADLIFVIGGRNSSNTTRLAEICRRYQRNTCHLETAEEIEHFWLGLDSSLKKKIKKIGIVTGASTPDWIIKEVIAKAKSSQGDKK